MPAAGAPAGGRYPAGTLHGRQQGRRLRDAQQRLLDDLLPTLAVPLAGPIEPAVLFGRPLAALRLEIGFGAGEHLLAQARRHPETGFIGCEPFRNGVASLLHAVEAEGLRNVRVHAGDGGEVLRALATGALSRVDLLYPDPWPKRRQRKRRFVSAASLAEIARVLGPGGEFRFATDIDDYAGWTLARAFAEPAFAWAARTADDWRLPWPDWVATRYEAKAERENRRPAYLSFLRR